MAKGPNTVQSSYKEYSEDDSVLHGMFGSLMAVTKPTTEKKYQLADNWWRIVRKWYPEMHTKVVCVPPVFFNSVSYSSQMINCGRQKQMDTKQIGVRVASPVQYSTVKADETQQRVLWTLSAFLRYKQRAAFVLSDMKFEHYLNKDYENAPGANNPLYSRFQQDRKCLTYGEGDVDVLIIDKQEGIILLEVKAIGDNADGYKPDESQKLKELTKKFATIAKQVDKQRKIIINLLSIIGFQNQIRIRSGIVLSNTPRDLFEKALNLQSEESKSLMTNMQASSMEQLSRCTFCAEDLPGCFSIKGSDQLDPSLIGNVESVWNALQHISKDDFRPMSDDMYEHVAALFCGPLTTVKICTDKSMPRVRLTREKGKSKDTVVFDEVRSQAGGAREVARRFSELVLQLRQIDILNRREEFVHLEGPPGTGKTLLLLMRILMWLDEGHKVWILSFSSHSRSVTYVLLEQTRRMLDMYFSKTDAEERKKNLTTFILSRPLDGLDPKYFNRRLLKFRDRARFEVESTTKSTVCKASLRDKRVCLVVDESGMTGEGLHDFFKQVAFCHRRKDFNNSGFEAGLSVWSASVERVGRPCYVAKPNLQTEKQFGVLWKLQMPLRCPPTVQRALMLVQPSLDRKNICFFKKEHMLPHPAVYTEKGEGHNQYPAEGLEVHLIAHGNHPKAQENIWECRDCGFELAKYLKNVLKIGSPESEYVMSDIPLQYKDVMIVATMNAFQFSLPISGFAGALRKEGLKVAVSTSRDEGDKPISDNDVILITDMTSVHGLERAVIIIVPEVKKPAQVPTRYKTSFFVGPENVQESDPMSEVLAATGGNFSLTADGQLRKEETDESDSDDASQIGREESEQGNSQTQTGGVDNMKVDQASSLETPVENPIGEHDYDHLNYADTDSESEDQEDADRDDQSAKAEKRAKVQFSDKDRLTYANSFSERQIQAALASLSEQSQKDVFYIGSRTVSQMILFHLGKNPDSTAERLSGAQN